ncbi:MAG: urate hydroxylase PuuD [Mariprofundaceae bacterium]|nr:urate hydroxylase PuuD [Mariprofundaceae bacterium]
MKILQDHKLTMIAGFVLAAIIVAIAAVTGDFELTKDTIKEGIFNGSRWLHVLSGILWIGLLYYFNFVQVPSMGGFSADSKAELFKEGSIVRRALHWFRMGANLTLLFGIILFVQLGENAGWDIRIGALFGVIMWFNVMFIIWPNQKKIIGMVEATADEKAAAGKKALIASRINTLLSIPMLLLMIASAHFRMFS